MALVVTLALLLLVTILILTFFSQATLNRQISFASAAQSRADNLSQTALQTIVNDLREEMAAGSTITTNASASPTYVPLTNFVMVPQRLGSTGLTNLVKMSVGGSNSWSGANYRYSGPIRSIAGNSTANASANGRYLPLSSWLSPRLLTPAETNLLKAPDWVIVTRQGPLTNAPSLAMSDFTNRAATNGNYVIGRYAYTVYDIGGLLDANVAGYASTTDLTASDLARKGSLSLVPLTSLPDMTTAKNDALVNWRIPATNYASTNYYGYVRYVVGTNGFLRPVTGGGAFLTRQDLITYANLNGLTNALPFLTSFSREKNSPSWKPSKPNGSLIDYAALAETAGVANRNLANMRAADGTSMIKSRFDLNRLAWLTYKGPSANLASTDPMYNANGTDANIKKYFGLAWDTSTFDPLTEHGEQWVYTSPEGAGITPSTIRTLDQIVGREPDFFELLKAGILSGSLGLNSMGESLSYTNKWVVGGNAANSNGLSFRLDAATNSGRMFNEVPDYQVFAIGANILTQYTSDGYPQFVQTPGGNVIGVKSMPFESAHGLDAFRPIASFETNVNRDTTYFWLKFVVWNPYRNANIAGPTNGPTTFRVHPVSGVIQGTFQDAFGAVSAPVPASRDFSADTNVAVVFSSSNNNFKDPTPLTYGNTIASTDNSTWANYGRNQASVIGKDIAGIFLSKVKAPDYLVNPTVTTNNYTLHPEIYFVTPRVPLTTPVLVDLRTQYMDANGNWRSYQISPNTMLPSRALDDNASPPGPVSRPYTNTFAFGTTESAYPDPRERRFGLTQNRTELAADTDTDGTNTTFRSSSALYKSVVVYFYSRPANFISASRTLPGFYSDNTTATAGRSYYDLDGVMRPGDGNGLGSIPAALTATAGASRPLVLNAPFHSVADIGYTFRDLPWKSLDFATTSSADAGLLDLFSLNGGMTNSLPVVAGKVNINSASAPVLQALLSGAMTDFSSTDLTTVGTTLSASDVTTLVNAMRPVSGSNPVFINKADLVAFFATNFPAAISTIKGQREAPIRALADVAQTRTWNLLIDVVAQAGRYAPSASGVDKFMVEGEKHYWLQVAIDRFTGEIVDQQLEPVYEQ